MRHEPNRKITFWERMKNPDSYNVLLENDWTWDVWCLQMCFVGKALADGWNNHFLGNAWMPTYAHAVLRTAWLAACSHLWFTFWQKQFVKMPRPKKVEPPVGWPLLCGLALCTAKCPKPEWSEARKCWSGLAARSPMATHWIYKINQHERMYEVLGIQLVSVWSMCISTLVSSVIVSHFLDTSMIVQVESIRHLSYCLQAESCKWQVQPSPLLLGRESRIISAWVQNRHWGWDDIGRAEVVPPFLFFSFFSPGHLRTTSTWTWTHRIFWP